MLVCVSTTSLAGPISSATGLTRWEAESLHNSVIAMGLTQADRDLSLILGKREELSPMVSQLAHELASWPAVELLN